MLNNNKLTLLVVLFSLASGSTFLKGMEEEVTFTLCNKKPYYVSTKDEKYNGFCNDETPLHKDPSYFWWLGTSFTCKKHLVSPHTVEYYSNLFNDKTLKENDLFVDFDTSGEGFLYMKTVTIPLSYFFKIAKQNKPYFEIYPFTANCNPCKILFSSLKSFSTQHFFTELINLLTKAKNTPSYHGSNGFNFIKNPIFTISILTLIRNQ